jgi:purine-binding chemotaxis protein CheW
MEKTNKIVVFSLDDHRFAIHLRHVHKVIHAVEITQLPKAPEYVLGIINYHGKLIPVINVRRIFQLDERKLNVNDKFIIVDSAMRTIALWVDNIHDIIDCAQKDIINSEKIMLGIKYVEGVLKFENGMVLLHDLDQFLTIEEVELLKRILSTKKEKEISEANTKKKKAVKPMSKVE